MIGTFSVLCGIMYKSMVDDGVGEPPVLEFLGGAKAKRGICGT